MDHCGALYGSTRGFRGKVIASRITLETIPALLKGAMRQDLGTSGTEIRLKRTFLYLGQAVIALEASGSFLMLRKENIVYRRLFRKKSQLPTAVIPSVVSMRILPIDRCTYGNEMTDVGDHLKAP